MLQIHARRWLVLSLTSVLLDGNVLVAGQEQQGRFDILTGTKSQTSCTLRDTIHSSCNLVIPPPPLDVNPIPSLCTCNKVYFNIWSACSYATGNNTLPVFQNWTQICTNSNVDLLSSEETASTKGKLGIDIPSWAPIDVPGNSTFDVQRAVVLVGDDLTKHWSIFQILAPLISAVVAVLMTFVLIFYCRPRIGRTNWRGRVQALVRPVPRMRPVAQPMQWGIDEDVHGPSGIPPPMVDPRSPIETTDRITNFSIPGNPSAPPSGYDNSLGQPMDPFRSNIPGGRVYPFAPTYAPNNPQAWQPTPGQSSGGSSRFNMIPNFPLPWKARPPHMKVVQPGPQFKVDHREQSLQGISSAASTQSSFTSWGPERPRGSFDVHEHQNDQEEAMVMESHVDDQGSEHEGTSLISEEQRRSMLTSQAHSSSINSHVGIVPPSNSSSSPRDSRPGSMPFFFRRNPPPVPVVPPPPTQPAPPPPSGQRSFRREGPLGTGLAQLPSDRLMATIQEHDRRTPSPIPSQPILHRPRPSIDNPRPLPQPANASTPPRPDVLSAHLRSNSQTGSGSSVYEDNSMTGYTASGESRPTPERSGSGDSQVSLQRSAFARPLPPTHANNISLSNRSLPQNNYPPAHQRSASGSSSSGANMYQDPFAPSAGHGRGLDWDDDGASFYLEAAEPPRLVRSPSPNQTLGDTAMLFHPSVRGAGYTGRPN